MPGDGFEGGPETCLWAQRCKLYMYRRAAKGWVDIGMGKASLGKSHASSRMEFVFEDEENRMPMVRHYLDTATPLISKSGAGHVYSWTARDQIQVHPDEEQQWFAVKLSSVAAAKHFKDVFDCWVPAAAAGGVCEDEWQCGGGKKGGGNNICDSLLAASPLKASFPASPLSAATPSEAVPPIMPLVGGGLDPSSVLALGGEAFPPSPLADTSSQARAMSASGGFRSGEVYLLYFETGRLSQGCEQRSMKQASTIYIGAYTSKEQALRNAVRAMDAHKDPKRSWRNKRLWTRCEDFRSQVGDKGIVLAVYGEGGVYFQTKIRKMHLNADLPQYGSEGDNDFWQ